MQNGGETQNSNFSLDWRQRPPNGFKIHESLYIYQIIVPELLSKPEKIELDSYVLEPQNVINIILKRKEWDNSSKFSLEDIKMNDNQLGLLFPKIEQYRKGIWVIEPCFIHPKYTGAVSVHVCNLSKVPVLINKNDPLMEMIIFTLNDPPGKNIHNSKENKSYYRDRRAETLLFPKTFLDITENVKKIKDEVGVTPFRNMLLIVLAIFTLIVGASGWVNWDIGKQIREAVINEKVLDEREVREEIDANVKLEKSNLEREIEILKKRVQELEGKK